MRPASARRRFVQLTRAAIAETLDRPSVGIGSRVNKRKLPQAEVATFIADLQEAGATGIRRKPADLDGLVEVRWGDSEVEQRRYAAEMQAWRLPVILSGLLAAIIILALVFLQ